MRITDISLIYADFSFFMVCLMGIEPMTLGFGGGNKKTFLYTMLAFAHQFVHRF